MARRLFFTLWATGAVLWLAGPVSAQTPLSLTQAIEDALAHNPSLAAARASTRRAQAETRIVRAEWMPRINFSEAWQRSTQPVSGFGSRRPALPDRPN